MATRAALGFFVTAERGIVHAPLVHRARCSMTGLGMELVRALYCTATTDIALVWCDHK